MIASGGEDRQPDTRSERRETHDDEVVHVGVDESSQDSAGGDRLLVEEVEVDPPQRRRDQESGRGRGRGAGVPADLRDAEHDPEHRLAEHDQRQEAEPFRNVTRMDWGVTQESPRRDRCHELDRKGDAPEDVAPGLCECQRCEPDENGKAEGG